MIEHVNDRNDRNESRDDEIEISNWPGALI